MKYIIFLLITFAALAAESNYYFEHANNTDFVRVVNTGSHTLSCWVFSHGQMKSFSVRPGSYSIYYEVEPDYEGGCE